MSAEDGACLITMANLLQMKVELTELDHVEGGHRVDRSRDGRTLAVLMYGEDCEMLLEELPGLSLR
jgi:hypothetical protein